MGRAETIKRNEAASLDLRVEIDSLSRLVTFARESMQNELMSGMGYKQQGLRKETAKDLQALSTSLEKLVAMKIKLDQHLDKEADKLTPEQEKDALLEFFAGLTVTDRRIMVRRMVDRHNKLIVGTSYHPIKVSISESLNEVS